MTRLIARLVLAMLILPLSGAFFILTMFAVVGTSPGAPTPGSLLIVWAIVYTFIAVYWIALWRSMVRWTRDRQVGTGLAGAFALAISAALGLLMRKGFLVPLQACIMVGGGLVPIIWVLATVLIWRETPRERLQRISEAGTDAVSCPVCGYNLTGLREAVCPECGSRFTLDQLLAAQPHRDAVTLPREPLTAEH